MTIVSRDTRLFDGGALSSGQVRRRHFGGSAFGSRWEANLMGCKADVITTLP
jgi:hypothetical protein